MSTAAPVGVIHGRARSPGWPPGSSRRAGSSPRQFRLDVGTWAGGIPRPAFSIIRQNSWRRYGGVEFGIRIDFSISKQVSHSM
jgi:hypothetical protein